MNLSDWRSNELLDRHAFYGGNKEEHREIVYELGADAIQLEELGPVATPVGYLRVGYQTKTGQEEVKGSPSLGGSETSGERFARLAEVWREKSAPMSFSQDMAALPSYLAIIGMGPAALPFILDELRRQPDHWFIALRAITEADPIPADVAGKIRLMADAWVQWGLDKGFIK